MCCCLTGVSSALCWHEPILFASPECYPTPITPLLLCFRAFKHEGTLAVFLTLRVRYPSTRRWAAFV